LSVGEVLELHRRILDQTGGSAGIRDRSALFSAVAQPMQTFGGADLYPTLIDKAAALGYFLCRNHPFIDGNKRVAHASLEVMLVLNGSELSAGVDEQEQVMLSVAEGTISREQFADWVRNVTIQRRG
jgi:death-on-curing protein